MENLFSRVFCCMDDSFNTAPAQLVSFGGELTRVDVISQEFSHKCARLRVLKDCEDGGVGQELGRVVVDVFHGDMDVGLAVASSSVHRPHLESVLLLLLSVQGEQGLQLP